VKTIERTLQTALAVCTLGFESGSPVVSYRAIMLFRICSARRAAPFSPDLACASMTLVRVRVLGLKSRSPSRYRCSMIDSTCSARAAAPRSPDFALRKQTR
jgi:hypothetical protein